jgi:transglutaminase-like putative cysteine protease
MRIYPNLFFVLFCLFCFSSFGQTAPIKYGKIELPDLQMTVYPKDSSAEAVVLGDVGRAYFDYSSSTGFQVVYERLRRVKILKKSGYDWASINVPLYRSPNGKGEIDLYELKGFTYNIENGEITKTKLEKESVFLKKGEDGHSSKLITFPKVKEGSIIEYSYKIKSDFYYNFQDWVFQSSIPTVWSEFSVSVPEYFNYRQIMQGYEPLFINTVQNGETTFSIKMAAKLADSDSQKNYQASSVESLTAQTKEYRWAMKDIPAIRSEPFITTIDDYFSKIQFELSSTQFPSSPIKSYAESWESLNDRLVGHDFFGQQINRSDILNDIASSIKKSGKDTLGQIEMAYKYINQNINWNEKEAIYISSTLRSCLDSKKGNIAEINLLLVVLLKSLGFNANPVILSTRDNGRVLDNYVLLSKFNYLIAQVDVGGKDLLIDASAVNMPLGILPTKCLNGQGRLIAKNQTRWVDLKSTYKLSETTIGSFEITNGNLKGELTNSFVGYKGLNERQKYLNLGKDKYLTEHKQTFSNWNIINTSFTNIDNYNASFSRKQELSIEDFATSTNNHIYFTPILYNAQKTNPLKSLSRKFPVDLNTPIEETFIATYIIPNDYTIEEMPKNARVVLHENSGIFTYTISASEDGKIMLSSKVVIKKPIFYAEEYDDLRSFFDQIIQKHAEQIVLKKK